MSDTDPLAQFHAWYDKIERLNDLTRYSLAREAFFAGHRTRPAEPLEPSRDALDKQQRFLATYGQPQPYSGPREGRFYVQKPHFEPGPRPDYVQHGTVTGRFPRRQPGESLDYREPGRHPLAGPSPETLQRVHESIQRLEASGEPPKPRPVAPEDTLMFQKIPPETFEHTDSLWCDGDGYQFGPSGPVPTPVDPDADADTPPDEHPAVQYRTQRGDSG